VATYAGEDACGPRRARPLVRQASLKGIVVQAPGAWLAATFAKPGTAEGPVAWFSTELSLDRIVLYVVQSTVKVFLVPNPTIMVFPHPESTGAVE